MDAYAIGPVVSEYCVATEYTLVVWPLAAATSLKNWSIDAS